MMILQNLITTNHGKNGESKYDGKLTELDVMTTLIWFRVNGVLNYSNTMKPNQWFKPEHIFIDSLFIRFILSNYNSVSFITMT